MKRVALLIGIVLVVVIGFVFLGGSRSAEGPAQGGVTAAAGKAGAKGGGGPKGPQPVPVLAASVMQHDMKQDLGVTGTLKTDEDVQIGSRIAGKVVRVTVKEGDHVQRGQVLVQLDDREINAQI